ncbi:MAG: SPFH domain-containing protein [Patescibacteria group bacterium]|jgi:regulator of protease activity HflC (stomatin/prohibitin superfamily)
MTEQRQADSIETPGEPDPPETPITTEGKSDWLSNFFGSTVNELPIVLRVIMFGAWIFIMAIILPKAPIASLIILGVVWLLFGFRKIPWGHRALITIFDRRLPFALEEGWKPVIPFICGLIEVDIREREVKTIITHSSHDGLPIIAQVTFYWYPPRQEDEEPGLLSGRRLLSFTQLESKVIEEKLLSNVAAAIESETVLYTHDQLIGIHIVNILAEASDGKTVTQTDNPASGKIVAVRFEIAKTVAAYVQGIVPEVTLRQVVINRIDFDETTQAALALALGAIIEKTKDRIDVEKDILRAKLYMTEVNADRPEGQKMTLDQAYREIRTLDNAEYASKLGLGPQILQMITSKFTTTG